MHNQPTACNTQSNNTWFFHWLEFTVDNGYSPDQIITNILGLDPCSFTTNLKYQNGYKYCLLTKDKSIKILYGNDEGKCKVIISGKGCENLSDTILSITKKAMDGSCKFNRIDLTFDDHDNILDINLIKKHLFDKDFLCKAAFKTYTNMHSNAIETVSIGSGKKLLRIYNKAMESHGSEGKHWVRCEFQLKGKSAEKIVKELTIRNNLGSVFCDAVMSFIKFVDRCPDKNRSRWPICDWWKNFLYLSTGKRIPSSLDSKSSDSIVNWFVLNCNRALYESVIKLGVAIIYVMLAQGKINSEQRVLKRYNKNNASPEASTGGPNEQ